MNYEYLAIGASALSVILLFALVWLWMKISKIDEVRREFLIDDTTKKIDDVLVGHDKEIKRLSEQHLELGEYVRGLANANKKNFQKIGFVRFNPFGDAGGSISFTIALLDAESNGFVLTSLHGREGNRVYSKEINKGVSKSPLTEEEQEAIKQAA
ncbi:MAG TPA: DUF4446 family protein [Candidatus Binatia bacterium]|nr:DUF4446 family protein [Candidatus Binatia bacterium]